MAADFSNGEEGRNTRWMIEIGDVFENMVFLVSSFDCQNVESDINFLFVSTSWLERCPSDDNGVSAIVNCPGK